MQATRRVTPLVFLLTVLSARPLGAVPTHLWSQRFGDTTGQQAFGVAAGTAGKVYVTGNFEGTVDFGGGPLVSGGGADLFVACYDAAGAHVWSKRFGDASNQYGRAVAVDASDNVLVAGHFFGSVDFGGGVLTSAGAEDICLVKLDSNGSHVWSMRFGDTTIQHAFRVAVDGSGNVALVGYYLGTVNFGGGVLTSGGFNDIYLAKFDAAGTHVWSKRFGDFNHQYGYGVDFTSSGDVIIAGALAGSANFGGGVLASAGGHDAYVARFDAAGNHIWSQRFGDDQWQIAFDVEIDGVGDIIIAGAFQGAVDFGGGPLTSTGGYDACIAKLSGAGAHVWSRRFGDAMDQTTASVDSDDSLRVFATGYFAGAADFGGGILTSTGGRDVLAFGMDGSGNHLWSARFGDASDQFGMAVTTTSPPGSAILAGYFAGAADFGGGDLTSAGGNDVFVAKFGDPPATGAGAPPARPALAQNYPNPFNPGTVIEVSLASPSPLIVEVFDVRGALVARLDQGAQPAGTYRVPWDGRDERGELVSSGIYFYRLQANPTAARKMVLLR